MRQKSSLIKNTEAVKAMRTACGISSQLHTLSMTGAVVGLTEKQLANKISNVYEKTEAQSWAYPMLVGTGSRTTIIHASPTQKKIMNEELILIDMGVKFNGFASDITRTWPAGKKFSKEQKTIYEIVLKAQKAVIKAAKPGETLTGLHTLSREILLEGLLRHKVIKKDELNEVFPHKTSHWIGRLVHDDCPHFNKDGTVVKLDAGMVFTVEPGLYLKDKGIYSDIGIRIEDVVLVTEDGCEVISSVAKEVEEIEQLRAY
jgi:Xaa-Pro aminopeptidase